jgi:uncharacterized protein (DUF2062 family)
LPKRYFKKYLPSHERIRESRLVRFMGPLLRHHNLWHLNRRSVAGGVAAGAFAGLIPGPVQMLLAATFAVVFRVNLPVAVFTTLYSNAFTTIPLYLLAYEIGTLFGGASGKPRPPFEFDWHSQDWLGFFPALFHWIAALGPTFLVGLFVLASLLSLTSYFAVRGLWRLVAVMQWRKRAKRRGNLPQK